MRLIFSSLEFIYMYLPITFLVYFIIPAKFLVARNVLILIVSLIFYGWSEPLYIFIMFLSIFIDYTCGYFVAKHKESNRKKAKTALILSIVLNLSVLCFFKYFDFFVENLKAIPLLSNLKPLGISLPVGISFYTFQTMSYTMDIYLGEAKLQKNILSFGAYVTMFPQLIAGPIVRYRDVDTALRERFHNIDLIAKGIRRFVCGLAKKVLLANTAGAMYEQFVATTQAEPSILSAWMGVIFFSFQIYFDFSGYSDMAIGLGYIMGFDFPENFNYPYIAKSITDFWRRWHITLSTWFREYLYIPLGGNKKGKYRTFINLFIVWFLTGLWHGASWNFVLWGLYFWVLLVIEKTFLLKLLQKLPKLFCHIYSIIFIVFGWYIFIACDIEKPLTYLKTMFSGNLISDMAIYDIVRSIVFLVILVIASTPLPKRLYKKMIQNPCVKMIFTILIPLILLLCTAYLVDSSYNPFLYFRF